MANIANYLEEALLDHVMRGAEEGTDYTQPDNVYVALFDNTATDSELEEGTLTNEITGFGENGNRPEVTFTAPSQTGEGKAEIENTADIEWEDMPAVTVKYAAVMDNVNTGQGEILYWCPMVEEKTTNEGDIFRIPEGDLVLDLD